MHKYENHIYLKICEMTLQCFKETKFLTHAEYCKGLGLALKSGSLTNTNKRHIFMIIKYLDKYFTMSDEVSAIYIMNFLTLEKYLITERPVRLTNEFFRPRGMC
jgi:hypothetical protein